MTPEVTLLTPVIEASDEKVSESEVVTPEREFRSLTASDSRDPFSIASAGGPHTHYLVEKLHLQQFAPTHIS